MCLKGNVRNQNYFFHLFKSKFSLKYRWSSIYDCVTEGLFDFMMVQKWYAFSGNCPLNFNLFLS